MPPVRRLTGQTRENVIEMIGKLAALGQNDPDIGARLGLTASEVAKLRRDNDIDAGEQRWRGGDGR
jgi:hypothetical protein